VRDVTERKRREEEIERRNRELAALNAIAETVSGSLDLKEVLHRALDKVLDITGFEAGGIGLVDEAKELIVPMVHRGVPKDFLATFAQPRASDGLRWQSSSRTCPMTLEYGDEKPSSRGSERRLICP
jgi:GAF domain-containing protein